MSLQAVLESHARRQKVLAQRTAAQAARLWQQIDTGRIALSWRELLPGLLTAVATSQATAAAGSDIYIDDALQAQGFDAPAAGRVVSTAFAGTASDGRDLIGLLYEPAVSALVSIQQGNTLARAKATGLMRLDTIVRTQMADAGRAAESVAIAARPRVSGYVRMLSQPSCSRCIILAGRWYRWNAGFRRHPRCDCRAAPAQENVAGDLTTDPKVAFHSMGADEQDRAFGKAGAQAIREGADIAKVVNANRGTYTAAGRTFTHEGAGRRPRLMPSQIFTEARGDRDTAIRLLRLHGYIR
jgi:hypothetical protein